MSIENPIIELCFRFLVDKFDVVQLAENEVEELLEYIGMGEDRRARGFAHHLSRQSDSIFGDYVARDVWCSPDNGKGFFLGPNDIGKLSVETSKPMIDKSKTYVITRRLQQERCFPRVEASFKRTSLKSEWVYVKRSSWLGRRTSSSHLTHLEYKGDRIELAGMESGSEEYFYVLHKGKVLDYE